MNRNTYLPAFRQLFNVLVLCTALAGSATSSWAQTESVELIILQAEKLKKSGKFEAAYELGERWFARYAQASTPESEMDANLWSAIAVAYRLSSNPAKSLVPAENALALIVKFRGLEHPATATALNNLGQTYRALAQYEKALPLQLRSLAIREKILGADHPDTAQALNNLAQTYGALALHDKALPLQRRTLAIYEEVMGLEHLETATALNNLALTYGALAQYEKALQKQLLSLTIYEKLLGPDHSDTALALNNLAHIYAALAQYEKALQLQLRTLSIFERALGPEHRDTAQALSNLAETYRAIAQYDKALPLQLRSLGIREKVLGSEHPDTAQTLNNLALIHNALGQNNKALPLQLRTLAIQEKQHGPEHLDTATALHNLAFTLGALARYYEALPLQLRTLAIFKNGLGLAHPATASALNNLALTYNALAQYDKALPLQLQALAVNEKALGVDHPAIATALNNLALTYNSMAQHDKALPLQLQALAINEKALGVDHPAIAIALNEVALTYNAMAQYDKALPLQLQALAINEKALGVEHPTTATALNNLALTYNAVAQYDKALPLQLQALAINERALGVEHPTTATALNNLALTYNAVAQYDKALPLQLRSLAIREQVQGPAHPDTATALNNLATTYGTIAQYDKALPLQLQSLTINEKSLGLDHPATAEALNNVALTYGALAQHNKAIPIQLRALAIFESALGPEHPKTAIAWSNLALSIEAAGSNGSAISFLKNAVNIFQTQRERVSSLGKEELQSYSTSIGANYQYLARLLVDQNRLAEAQQVLDMLKEDEQFDFIRRSSSADPRRTRMGYTPTEAKWMARYRQVADQLGALGAEEQALQKQVKPGLTPAQQARLKAIKEDLAVADKAFMSFLDQMQKGFAAQGPAKTVEVAEVGQQAQRDLQTLIRQLGPDVALLQYYITPDKVGMILTTAGVVLPFSRAVDAKVLNRQIFKYRNLLDDRTSNPMPMAQELYQLLLAPVAQALEQAGIKTVMLSLDGNLRQLPFGALHDGKQFAAQRWNLPMYTTVTKDRLRDAVTPRWKAAGLGVTRALGEFKALPAVKGELTGVLRASESSGSPGEMYLDEQFTAARLKDVGQRSLQLMHVSSHFQLSPGTEANSFLLLGDGQRLTLGEMRTQNYRFDQVDLLTLSACDTGLGGGRDSNGKEIEGLGVIAQQQGAKAVLATLWPVADQSTAILMTDMYQRRQAQGLSKIEALRQAQLALMAQPKYAHPFYWAPFILMGNWK